MWTHFLFDSYCTCIHFLGKSIPFILFLEIQLRAPAKLKLLQKLGVEFIDMY